VLLQQGRDVLAEGNLRRVGRGDTAGDDREGKDEEEPPKHGAS
jgi:hypothetical protein